MLTDENDCSIIDYKPGLDRRPASDGHVFHAARHLDLQHGSQQQVLFFLLDRRGQRAAGCTAPAADSECARGTFTLAEDHPNLRCYQQRRRFGFDLLHPVSRYVQGLTQPGIYNVRKPVDINGDGRYDSADTVPNPLLVSKDGKRRDRSLVFLAGIIGVPWQDIADEESWGDPRRLRYLRYDEMVNNGRWDWILSANGAPPKDALMYETNFDRTTIANLPQAHPAGAQVGGSLASAATTTLTNPINGHEANINDGGDLQYACIFPLTMPVEDCDQAGGGCDCKTDFQSFNRPLCQGRRQTHAKAFPGTRHLEVLKGVGEITGNSIVASICPKVSTAQGGAANDPNYGYNPAVNAIIDRLKDALKGKCLPRPLEIRADDSVPCVVIEARLPEPGAACGACENNPALPGRKTVESAAIIPEVQTQLVEGGFCGAEGAAACSAYCLCQIDQYTGDDLVACQTGTAEPTEPKGYCYVDGNPAEGEDPNSQAVTARKAIVASCPASQPRLLRFATEVPQKGAVAFIACLGKALGTAAAAP